MDFEIKTKNFTAFLNKIRCEKKISDAVIFCDNNKLSCRFSTPESDIYGEIYCDCKQHDYGSIKVGSLEKLCNSMTRFESEAVRVASSQDKFIVTDGKSVGKSALKLSQIDGEYIESFQRLEKVQNLFDANKLGYVGKKVGEEIVFDIVYKNGYEITIGALQIILKDANAFGYEIYNFFDKEGILNCTIKTKINIPDSFNRKIPVVNKLGETIPSITVSSGFKEIIKAISKDQEEKKSIFIYFHQKAILITDKTSFFYNLATLLE